MPVVSRAALIITGETDAAVDEVYRILNEQRDEQARLFVSIRETSRELER